MPLFGSSHLLPNSPAEDVDMVFEKIEDLAISEAVCEFALVIVKLGLVLTFPAIQSYAANHSSSVIYFLRYRYKI